MPDLVEMEDVEKGERAEGAQGKESAESAGAEEIGRGDEVDEAKEDVEDAEDAEGGDESPSEEQPQHVFDDDIQPSSPMPTSPAPTSPHPKSPPPTSPHSPPQTAPQTQPQTPTSLYTSISVSPSSTASLVSSWLASLHTNGPGCVASLLSLVISMASPAPLHTQTFIHASTVIHNQPVATTTHIGNLLAAHVPARVAIHARDASAKRVRRAFEDVFRRLAVGASDVVVHDTDLFETLLVWLEALCMCSARSLRLAACVAAYRLVDGFVERGARIRAELVVMQRQLVTERKRCGVDGRKRSARGGKLLSKKGMELVKKVDTLTGNNGELTELADSVFRKIFVLKSRDVSPEVRNVSVGSLGAWIVAFPDHFLDQTFYKYIGWLLSDKDAGVRRSSVEALLKMLKKKEFFPSLEAFLQRFCERIVEMARDKDDHVAVSAIKLLTALVQYNLIDRYGCESICDMAIEENHADIRRAAGEFLARLVAMDAPEDVAGPVRKRGASKQTRRKRVSGDVCNVALKEIPSLERSREDIKELMFAITRKGYEGVTPHLAIDAAWDHLPALRCWEAFTQLLLEEPASANGEANGSGQRTDEQLNETDKAMICEMLLTSVKEASGHGDSARAKLVEKGEYLTAETPGTLLSRHLLPLMPSLLSHFQADRRALCALVEMVRYFRCRTFEQEGQEKNFATVVDKIIDALTRHTRSQQLSSTCAATLRLLLTDGNPLKKVAVAALQKGFAAASKDLTLHVRSDLATAEPDSVAAAVLRVRILSELNDPGTSVYPSIVKLLEYQEENGSTSELGDVVTADGARTACALMLWSLLRLRSRFEPHDTVGATPDTVVDKEEIEEIQKQGGSIVDLLQKLCESSTLPIGVRTICLKSLLTSLNLARGIEKFAAGAATTDTTDEAGSGRGYDFLDIRDRAPHIVRAVKSCVYALVEHELHLVDHGSMQSTGYTKVPDVDVRDCFICLIQCSSRSRIQNEISHLPLLGLLLKRHRHDVEGMEHEFNVHQICRKYSQQRQLQESSLIKAEVRLLKEVRTLGCGDKNEYHQVRELAEALLTSRHHVHLKVAAAEDMLQGLLEMTSSSQREGDALAANVGVLANAGFAFVKYIADDHAKKMLDCAEEIKGYFASGEGEELPAEANMLDSLCTCLEAVSKKETPDIPKASKKERPVSGKGKTTRKRKRRKTSNKAYNVPSRADNNVEQVRKSTRRRERVNYARLGGMLSESEEDGLSDASDGADVGSPASAAEIARGLMEYTHSPRVPGRKEGDEDEMEDVLLQPAKRRRVGGGDEEADEEMRDADGSGEGVVDSAGEDGVSAETEGAKEDGGEDGEEKDEDDAADEADAPQENGDTADGEEEDEEEERQTNLQNGSADADAAASEERGGSKAQTPASSSAQSRSQRSLRSAEGQASASGDVAESSSLAEKVQASDASDGEDAAVKGGKKGGGEKRERGRGNSPSTVRARNEGGVVRRRRQRRW